MKKSIGLFAIMFLVLTACGPSSRVSEPEDISDQVMDIITELDDMSKEDFKEEFMSFDEVQDLADDEDLIKDSKVRKQMKKMKESEVNEDYERSFARIIEEGSENKIEWSEAEFVDFEYEVSSNGGMKSCRGKVIFKVGSKKYSMRSNSIYDGSGYCLVRLSGPNEYRD
jgi:hypothetical protein